jgi:PIN domain nuclease of toxin-antitoxin system
VASQPTLDASALLALLQNERGAEVVEDAIADGATISTVNLAEALSTMARKGADPATALATMTERGVIGGAITVEPFTLADAVEAARLRPLTATAGLSLGDRSCLALARRLGTPALTADQPWRGIDLPVEVRSIRERKP